MSKVDEDFDAPDEDERKVAARRLFMYSPRALQVAAQTQRVVVNHPDFTQPLAGCDRVFQLSRELNLQQGAVIAGPTGVGKTALIRFFRESLPSSSLFQRGLGALAVRTPKRPHAGHFVGALLRQIRYPFPQVTTTTMSIKRELLIEALQQKGTRLLFVDEAQHLKGQTRLRSRDTDGSTATDVLRELMDEVPLGLCLCGTEELLELQSIDESLNGRVSARFRMRDFEYGSTWHAFLRAFHRQSKTYSLEVLTSKEEAQRLHKATGGNPRAFKRLITEAVLVAVDGGCDAVSTPHLKAAYAQVYGASPPAGGPYAD